MRNLLIAVLIFLASCGTGYGAVSYTAATCSQANVQTAVTSCTNDAQCVQVNIPSGTSTWSGSINISKAITVRGAGATNTVLTLANGVAAFSINAAARITGIGFYSSVNRTTRVGFLQVYSQGWRIDNCTFQSSGGYGIYVQSPYGLIDNNTFTCCRILVNRISGSLGTQNQVWAADAGFGTSAFVYVEDNTMTRCAMGNVMDASQAGKYVFRFNTYYNGDVQAHVQATTSERSTRAWEIYNNTAVGTSQSFFRRPFFLRAGEGYVFNNTISGTWSTGSNTVLLDSRRAYDTQVPQCDGTYASDGNEAGENGWLCRDQIGAGKDSELTTFTGTWGNYTYDWATQTKSPVYIWGNTTAVSLNLQSYLHIQANRDYYDGGTWGLQTSSSSPFNGTSGTGRGTFANRPATCTTGVAYWATDRGGNWNTANADANDGCLYKCTGTNTWAASCSYTPYTYPHPLRGGGGGTDTTNPILSAWFPTTQQTCSADPQTVNLGITSDDENITTCKWGTSTAAYADLPNTMDGAAAGTANHTDSASFACNATHTIYYACSDDKGNVTDTASWTFSLPALLDETTPVITSVTSSKQAYYTTQKLSVTTSVAGSCRYCVNGVGGCASDTAWADRTAFSVTGGQTTHHEVAITQAASSSATYNVICQNTQGTATSANSAITVTTDAAKAITAGTGSLSITQGSGGLSISILP
jgi:hypothetical protein